MELCTKGHFWHVGCVDCIAARLYRCSLEQAEAHWERGEISRDHLDGYRHVWALSATRSRTYDHWQSLPDTGEGCEMAATLIRLAEERNAAWLKDLGPSVTTLELCAIH
jgi:hypothetical protein